MGGAIRDVLLGVEPSFSKPDLIMAQDSIRFHQVSSGFIRSIRFDADTTSQLGKNRINPTELGIEGETPIMFVPSDVTM